MNIFNEFVSRAKGKSANIGIGLGDSEFYNLKILNEALQFVKNNNSNIYFFGNKPSIGNISKHSSFKKKESRIFLVEGEEPEKEMIEQLKNSVIDAIVRGSLSSSEFLKNVKKCFDVPEINRLALLETSNGFQFFYGPVGIDECNSYEKKITFIKKAIRVLESLKIKPKISVLSGGRIGDVGRDPHVDETIRNAVDIVEYFKKENPDLTISHDEILIEKAIENKSNLIVAPDGISGNLIYRTLVHLGDGKAYGAIYMDIDRAIIDTSRVGNQSEIYGALILALALAS